MSDDILCLAALWPFPRLQIHSDNDNILRIISQRFLGRILQTSHISMIFSATPITSCINGTGMRAPADFNNNKACFPVDVMYSVVGTAFRGLSGNFWSWMCVRGLVWRETILSPLWSLSPYLVPPLTLPFRSLVHLNSVRSWLSRV